MMNDPNVLTMLGQALGGLTVTGVFGLIAWAFVTGKVPTKGELQRVVDSERRAWEQAAEAKEALKANNVVLERMTDALGQLRVAVDAFTRSRGGNGDD